MNLLDKLNEIEGVDFSSIEYETGRGNACLGMTTNLSFEELDPKVVKVFEDNCELLRMEAKSIHKMEANPNLLKDCHYRHYPIYPLIDNFSQILDKVNTIPCPDNAEVLSEGNYYVPAKYASDEILTENAVVADLPVKNDCPDCKDGFYYPFVGPPEPCQTCKESPAYCGTCEGTNYFLSHPEGTPGPCPDCNGDDPTTRPPADIASYEGDSSQDVAFDMRGTDSASFDRACRTAFNDIVNKDHPLILYSANELQSLGIEFYSQDSRERRIALLIYNIKQCLNEEVLCNGVKWFDINIKESKFFELWDMDRTAWKTGVHLKMTPNYGEQNE